MKSIRMKLTSNLIIENISTFYVNFSVNFYFQDIYISFSIFKMKMIYKPRAIKFQRANTWKKITSWYFFSVKLNKENTYKMQKVRIQVWKYFNKPKNAIICEWARGLAENTRSLSGNGYARSRTILHSDVAHTWTKYVSAFYNATRFPWISFTV